MNILMLTNTFMPYVGGVARSVQRFVDEYRRQGHRVMVAAPLYKNTPKSEIDVVRFPAIQHFNGTEFSLPMPLPGRGSIEMKRFQPDIVHAHHPFALGGTAMRIAAIRGVPLIFTHHTMYEKYTHYIPGDSLRLKRYVVNLVSGYCNFCDAVIAPSESVADLLRKRGVETPITVIPTGVDTAFFRGGAGMCFRKNYGIPRESFVVGHVGRMATEKNLEFLARGVGQFLQGNRKAYFVLVGEGPMTLEIRHVMEEMNVAERFCPTGLLEQEELSSAYKAMDAFAFSSHTETQGMVLAEAMAAGVPVVALDASGVREVVRDGVNGRLLVDADLHQFAAALDWVAALSPEQKALIQEGVEATSRQFDIARTANKALELYHTVSEEVASSKGPGRDMWMRTRRGLQSEWRIMSNIAKAAGSFLLSPRGYRDDSLKLGIRSVFSDH
ncbi:MAG: glycosyltransferase [Gammaproteobacteria bacterium]